MSVKTRHWWFIAYPESLPPNWYQFLELSGLPCYISPLHLNDIDINSGDLKKPHYHVIVSFDGPTTFNHVVQNLCVPLNCPAPKPCLHLRGCYDYLTHKNNPEKAQYSSEEIVFINGANEKSIDEETFYNESIIKLVELIDSLHIESFRQLVGYAVKKRDQDLLSFVRHEVYFIQSYLYK